MWSLEPFEYLRGLPLDYVTNFSSLGDYFAKNYTMITPKNPKISDDTIACIEKYSRKIGAPSPVFENIERLKENPIIVTGQQPCLLTGPLFVIYKALTAVILAEKYDAVPVFWNASEDDDAAEVNHIWVMNGDLEKISVDFEPQPFFKILLMENALQSIIEQLEELTPSTEFRKAVLEVIPRCSLPFSEVFSRILTALFSDYGLIVVEPHIFSELTIPVYRKFIEHPVKAAQLVNQAGDSLKTQGYKRQLHKPDDSCSFYLLCNHRRHNVTYDQKFKVNSTLYTEKELLDLLDEHPALFSSNVISRPLIQDFLFSSLAYCAGPGEITYFAQMNNVYAFFDIEEPYIVPRFGATILENKTQKVLDKYSITISDLREPERILKNLAKEGIRGFFNRCRKDFAEMLREIEEYMTSVDFNLKKSSKAMSTHILKDLATLEEKTAAARKRQNLLLETQVAKASANIFPRGNLQERVLNVFQYLIRYPSFVKLLHESFHTASLGDHLIVRPGD
ncbi:MAG: bacillithiol biosynthesis cysteine-adding enzyme BshC [Theionarchaea archaeon]|nr:MAG: hypothetical protein AYK18_04330 [Theionarchaea archaeon DG-70]MBU7012832.1 bacillithiol biosynthesis cysteine-adding enzyme BshC [Theionarchaea archaeon]